MKHLHLLFVQPELNIQIGIALVTQLLEEVEKINGHGR
jgi:hypothetical protein